jgi:uncharacterized protein (DUF983 family)
MTNLKLGRQTAKHYCPRCEHGSLFWRMAK